MSKGVAQNQSSGRRANSASNSEPVVRWLVGRSRFRSIEKLEVRTNPDRMAVIELKIRAIHL